MAPKQDCSVTSGRSPIRQVVRSASIPGPVTSWMTPRRRRSGRGATSRDGRRPCDAAAAELRLFPAVLSVQENNHARISDRYRNRLRARDRRAHLADGVGVPESRAGALVSRAHHPRCGPLHLGRTTAGPAAENEYSVAASLGARGSQPSTPFPCPRCMRPPRRLALLSFLALTAVHPARPPPNDSTLPCATDLALLERKIQLDYAGYTLELRGDRLK